MTMQAYLNYALSALLALVIWILNQNIQQVDKIESDLMLTRLMISSDYLTRSEYDKRHDQLIVKIDNLSEEINAHTKISEDIYSKLISGKK